MLSGVLPRLRPALGRVASTGSRQSNLLQSCEAPEHRNQILIHRSLHICWGEYALATRRPERHAAEILHLVQSRSSGLEPVQRLGTPRLPEGLGGLSFL